MKCRQLATSLDGIRADHVARYRFAVKHSTPGRTLDAACGCGYGSRILHDAKHRVVGVDVDPKTIVFAGENYGGPGYICGDILDAPWVGVFDYVVSFETIEHIQLPEVALKLFRESLDGKLFISTPNQNTYPFDAGNFRNDQYPHHRHYTPEEFDALLETAGFKVIERHSQTDAIEPGVEGRYLIYVCS